MTHAVMLAAHMAPPRKLDEGWYEVIEAFKAGTGPKPASPGGDGSHDFVGFYVACGPYEEDGVPALDKPLNLSDIDSMPKSYWNRYQRCLKAWTKFEEHAKEAFGIKLPAAKLWLVLTEVG